MLSRWCGETPVDTCLADMLLVRCEQKLSYCCRLRVAISANMEVVERNLRLEC